MRVSEKMITVDEEKSSLRIRIFTGKEPEEWASWKLKFKAILDGKDLLGNLLSKKPGETANHSVIEAWNKKDQKIFYQLVLHTGGAAGDLIQQFEETCSGSEAWRALIAKYEHKGKMGKVELVRELMGCSLKENDDPDIFLVKIDTMRRKLKSLGQDLTDDLFQAMILSKLPPAYNMLVTALGVDDEDNLDMEGVKGRIRSFWKRQIQGSGDTDEGDEEKALFAGKQNGFRGKRDAPRRAGGKVTCFGCGEMGHVIADCPKKQSGPSSRDFSGRCFLCNKQGHKVVECPNLSKNQMQERGDGNHDNANAVFQQDEEGGAIALLATTAGKQVK